MNEWRVRDNRSVSERPKVGRKPTLAGDPQAALSLKVGQSIKPRHVFLGNLEAHIAVLPDPFRVRGFGQGSNALLQTVTDAYGCQKPHRNIAVQTLFYEIIEQKGRTMDPQANTAQGVGNELLADAKGVGTSAVNRLHSEIDTRKGDAATQVKSVSNAIKRVSDGLDPNAPSWLKTAIEQGAQQVQKFADTLEHTNSRELMGQVNDLARSSPGTFLAACAAAGFAAARVFKAGGSSNTPAQLGPVGDRPQSVSNQYIDGSQAPSSLAKPRGEFA